MPDLLKLPTLCNYGKTRINAPEGNSFGMTVRLSEKQFLTQKNLPSNEITSPGYETNMKGSFAATVYQEFI